MQRYLIQRLLYTFVSLVGLSILVFILLRAVPGDAAVILAGDESVMTEADIDEIRTEMGLNDPLVVQYVRWGGGVVQGDCGISLFTSQPVLSLIWPRLPVSVELCLMALLFAVLIAAPLGILAALQQDGFLLHPKLELACR